MSEAYRSEVANRIICEGESRTADTPMLRQAFGGGLSVIHFRRVR
jgi:hypothetical protein